MLCVFNLLALSLNLVGQRSALLSLRLCTLTPSMTHTTFVCVMKTQNPFCVLIWIPLSSRKRLQSRNCVFCTYNLALGTPQPCTRASPILLQKCWDPFEVLPCSDIALLSYMSISRRLSLQCFQCISRVEAIKGFKPCCIFKQLVPGSHLRYG